MGSNDLSLQVVLKVQDSASGSLKGFGSTLVNLAGDAGPLLKVFGGISLAAIGIGVQAVQMAAQYQQSMNMVQALTGASSAQMAFYDTQLKSLAIDAGVAPNALAQGLYQVISAGYQGADAMKVLTLSTEDSKIGMTDAKTTAEALTNVLANFSWQTKDATQVNGIMLETVTLGKSTFQQYASTITKAASTSAQFHISLQTMSAAWATMTANGISAGKASTDYVQLVQAMDGKIGTITKSLQKNGIAFNEAKFNSMSFGDKVQYLNQVLGEAAKKHVSITGVTLQAAQAITVISGHIGVYNSNLATLSNNQAMSQKTAQAWAITQSGFNQALSRAQAAVQVLFIDIGQQLLPVLTKMVDAVAPAVLWFIHFASAMSKNEVAMDFLKGALAGFAAVALMILVPAFISWAIAAGAAALATLAATWPILLIGALIAGLVVIILLLWQHWNQVSKWIMGALTDVGTFFKILGEIIAAMVMQAVGFFVNLGTQVGNVVMGIINWFESLPNRAIVAIASLIVQGEKLFRQFWQNVVSDAKSILGNIGDAIASAFKKAIDFIFINPINGIIDGINRVTGVIHIPAIPHIPQLAQGGDITAGGTVLVGERGPELLQLPTGARVTPLLGSGSSGGTSGGSVFAPHVVVYAGNANASQVADLVMDRLSRLYRRSGLQGNPAVGVRNS